MEYVPASDMSERLFWGRSRRHMVPPLTPLTTYAPLPPALVTAQQTFPVFVQILEEKKGWLPAATTNHISTLASRALLAIPLLALLRFQPDTSFYSHIELCLKHQSCEFHLKNVSQDLTRPQYFPFCIFAVLPAASLAFVYFAQNAESRQTRRKNANANAAAFQSSEKHNKRTE